MSWIKVIDLSKFLDSQHILDSLRAGLGLRKVALIPYPAVLSFNSVPVVGSRTVSIAIIIIFMPTSTKPRAWKLSKNNGCDYFLFGVHCVEEGDRIPPLQSYGQALKQKDCFSGVLGDDLLLLLR